MRRHGWRPLFLVAAATLATAGCNGLSNEVFTEGGGTLTGRLLHAGLPVADATLYVVGAQELTTTSDEDGSFWLAEVPSGPQSIVADDGQGVGLRFEVLMVRDRQTRAGEVELLEYGVIFGRTIDLDGRPVEGVEVGSPGTPLSATTDSYGYYRIAEVPPGCYPLEAAFPNRPTVSITICLDEGEEKRADFDLLRECEPEPEVCDARDNDCDGQVDEGGVCNICDGVTCTADQICHNGVCVDDCRVHGCPGQGESCNETTGLCEELPCLDSDQDGYDCRTDCDDTNAAVHPGAVELCNGIDDDCDGQVDDDCVTGPELQVAPSAIDFGAVALGNTASGDVTLSNTGDSDLTIEGIDIASGTAFVVANGAGLPLTIRPGATVSIQITFAPATVGRHTGTLRIRAADPAPPAVEVALTGEGVDPACQTDGDGDGWCAEEDCDDGNPEVHPGAEELCDGIDNNCNGEIEEGFSCIAGETRACGSDVGVCQLGVQTCTDACHFDAVCEGEVGPGTELCNGLDDDCDGQVDEACVPACTTDADCDGGSVCVDGLCQLACSADSDCAAGEVCQAGVCTRPTGAPEIAVAGAGDLGSLYVGESVTGTVRVGSYGAAPATLLDVYVDPAETGFVVEAGVSLPASLEPGQVLELSLLFTATEIGEFAAALICESDDPDSPQVTLPLRARVIAECGVDLDGDRYCAGEDCDDRDPDTHAGAPDICDGFDNDCDGSVDEDCPGCVPGTELACGSDVGQCTLGTTYCQVDGLWSECLGGTDPLTEICDGLDNDCDGEVDEGC